MTAPSIQGALLVLNLPIDTHSDFWTKRFPISVNSALFDTNNSLRDWGAVAVEKCLPLRPSMLVSNSAAENVYRGIEIAAGIY